MKNISFILLFCFNVLLSCTDIKLEQSLKMAGDNRPELEKVLAYYKNDRQKLKAAKFLIRNMEGHFFYESDELDSYYSLQDSILSLTHFSKRINEEQRLLLNQIERPSLKNAKKVYDLEYVTADLLIDNIDKAFEAWQSPFSRNMKFEDFCEYLLPYKTANERPVLWRSAIQDSISPYITLNLREIYSLTDKDTGTEVTEILDMITGKVRSFYSGHRIIYNSWTYDGFVPNTLLHMKEGSCYDYSLLGNYIFRSMGIGAAIDHTPVWANRDMGHEWNILFDGQKMNDFSLTARDSLGTHLKNRKDRKSKIYRETFAKQKGSLDFIRGRESIPEYFMNPRLKDVTDEYLDCMDFSIQAIIDNPAKLNYAYLCTFDHSNWIPVGWGKAKREKIYFKKVGKDVIYLPAWYYRGSMKPLADPFILSAEGKVISLKPDTLQTQTMQLYRKYPNSHGTWNVQKLQGGIFQVANNADFSDARTVHVIEDLPHVRYNYAELPGDSTYRYFRFLAKAGSYGGDIAEIDVFANIGEKLSGTIIGYSRVAFGLGLENVFDGNPLTYYRSNHAHRGEAGLDFGKPVCISHFRYLPRNDDNFIKEGEEYELFYWNHKWISLGKHIGTSKQYLEYTNAPRNALFWLRNHTKGKEERIFTYEEGEQVWW